MTPYPKLAEFDAWSVPGWEIVRPDGLHHHHSTLVLFKGGKDAHTNTSLWYRSFREGTILFLGASGIEHSSWDVEFRKLLDRQMVKQPENVHPKLRDAWYQAYPRLREWYRTHSAPEARAALDKSLLTAAEDVLKNKPGGFDSEERVRVVRAVVFEGTYAAVQKQIHASRPLGVQPASGPKLTITIAQGEIERVPVPGTRVEGY